MLILTNPLCLPILLQYLSSKLINILAGRAQEAVR